jgi:predicted nucleotidyltransferase
MEKHITPEILRKHLKPLLKYRKYLEAVYVYGSAVTKGKANDIDVMIIINDSLKFSPVIIDQIEMEAGIIEDDAKKQGMIFHFQPIKMLSKWWHLVLDGEPWIISSLKKVLVIYDKADVVLEISKLIRNEHMYKKEERAEKLIERSEIYSFKNRQLLLSSLHLLSDAATEAAQILLLFDNKFMLNKKKITEELERNYQKILGDEIIGNYKEIVDLEEKSDTGALSEFSAENLDYYLDKVKKFIAKVESMLSKK